jgi:hypothetical protein
MQSSRPKDKAEAGSSMRTSSLTDNTRTTTMQTQPTGSNAVPKRPRRTPTTTRTGSQPQTGKKDTSQAGEERTQGTTSGVQPSQTVRNPMQGKRGMQEKEI